VKTYYLLIQISGEPPEERGRGCYWSRDEASEEYRRLQAQYRIDWCQMREAETDGIVMQDHFAYICGV